MNDGPQTRYRVRGGNPLQGTVFVQGAKNAALKMIAASLLAEKGRTVLRNVPVIEDVRRAVELAQALGAVVKFHEAERTLVVDASELTSSVLPAEIARRFRASVLFVPALLHRLGEATIEGVGGCNLGSRNLDFHYRGFARLGARVDEQETRIHITAGHMRGAHLYLDTPSHTGTENLIMAASLAPGTTVIDNSALEPEVLDVIAFLSKMGARISGGGTGFVTVQGVGELTAVEHTVMPDRIDAAVFAMAAAMAGGEVTPGRGLAGRLRRGPLEAGADGRGVRHPRRHPPGAARPAAPADQRDHQPVPRIRHRPAISHNGAELPGRRHELHPRNDLRRPVQPGRRAEQDGRARSRSTAAPSWSTAPPRCAARRSSRMTCAPESRWSWPGWRPRARPSSRPATSSTAATPAWPPGWPPSAPTSPRKSATDNPPRLRRFPHHSHLALTTRARVSFCR